MSSTVRRTRVKIGGGLPLSLRYPAWRPNKFWDPSFHRMWYLIVRSIVQRIQGRCEITSPASSCRAVGWNICTPTPTCSSAGYHPNISFLLVSFLCIIEAMGLRGGSVPRKKRAALFMYSWRSLSVLPPHLNADLLVWRGCASLSKSDESSIARFANKKCVKRDVLGWTSRTSSLPLIKVVDGSTEPAICLLYKTKNEVFVVCMVQQTWSISDPPLCHCASFIIMMLPVSRGSYFWKVFV